MMVSIGLYSDFEHECMFRSEFGYSLKVLALFVKKLEI